MIQANINDRYAQLSQQEKAELIGIYTRAGYRDLASIIAHYNSCGGKLYADGGDEKKSGIKDWLHDRLVDMYYNVTFKPAIRKYGLDEVRHRLYDHVDPFGYDNARDRIDRALSKPPLSGYDIENKMHNVINSDARYRDDIWRKYLGVPEELSHLNGRDNVNRVVESQYGPTIGGSSDKYYTIGESAHDKMFGLYSGGKDDELVNTALFGEREVPYSTDESQPLSYGEVVGSNVLGRYFGSHSLSRGVDPQKGDYVSFYDLWDIAPSEGDDRAGSADESHGIGTPIPFYDRLYLDDYFKVDSRPGPGEYYGGYIMPSVSTANYMYDSGFASGGKIHIKPENRGKFTALKKRTGHSASWFKAHGTPAQKKMATFALNSKHWSNKHADGGPLFSDIRDIF